MAPTDNRPIIVWEADGRPMPGTTYATRLVQRLEAYGHAARVHPQWDRPFSGQELDASAHVLTGGATSVRASRGWMPRSLSALEKVLERARDGRATVAGICLGAQMIAEVLTDGRGTLDSPRGIEVGMSTIDPVAAPGASLPAGQFHYDDIAPDLVESQRVTHLFTNDHALVQAFGWGDRVVGVQAHVELGPDDLGALIAHNRETIVRHGGDVAVARSTVDPGAPWDARAFEHLVVATLGNGPGSAADDRATDA